MFRILYASITHLMVFNHLRIVVLLYNLPSLRFDFRTTEPSSYIIITLKIFVCKIVFFFLFLIGFFHAGNENHFNNDKCSTYIFRAANLSCFTH